MDLCSNFFKCLSEMMISTQIVQNVVFAQFWYDY